MQRVSTKSLSSVFIPHDFFVERSLGPCLSVLELPFQMERMDAAPEIWFQCQVVPYYKYAVPPVSGGEWHGMSAHQLSSVLISGPTD